MVDESNHPVTAPAAAQSVVVLDNGGCSIKLGLAGDASPM